MWLGAAGAFLALARVDCVARGPGDRPRTESRCWAIARRSWSRSGIGLHNLGEGLAIGSAYAVGSLALGATLVVGFALHNTTEGLAIVAPVARERDRAGRPARAARADRRARPRCWAHGSARRPTSPGIAALMFGVGAGAIAQVIVQIAPADPRRRRPGAPPARHRSGLLTGLVVMYVTGLLVSI